MGKGLSPEERAEVDRRVKAGYVTVCPPGEVTPEGEIQKKKGITFGWRASHETAAVEERFERKKRNWEAFHRYGRQDAASGRLAAQRGELAVDVAMRFGFVEMEGGDA